MNRDPHKPLVPSQDFLDKIRECFAYNPKTGVLTWKVVFSPRVRVGDQVGNVNSRGYLRTKLVVNGRERAFLLHHIAWFLYYGIWPEYMLDHKDENKLNNRIRNLRYATHAGNQQNISAPSIANKSTGIRGVSLHKKNGKFQACIRKDGRSTSLGYFHELKDAQAARLSAEKSQYKEFAPTRKVAK